MMCDRRVVIVYVIQTTSCGSVIAYHDSTYHLLGNQRTLHLTNLNISLFCRFYRLNLFRVIFISYYTASSQVYEHPRRQGIWCAPCK